MRGASSSRSRPVDIGIRACPLGLRGVAAGELAQMTPTTHTSDTGDALAEMADQFGQLAVLLADDVDQPIAQQRLVEYAVRGIPGAEYASMTVIDGDRPPRTTARSDELPYQWDQLQYRYGEGPCLDVIHSNSVETASDLRTDNRWPLFARAAVDQTPARSMLSFRLFLTGEHRAALNLYAPDPARSPPSPRPAGPSSPPTPRWRCPPRPARTGPIT